MTLEKGKAMLKLISALVSILSIGIDTGTSTICLIFSSLVFENAAPSIQASDIKIVKKEIICRILFETTLDTSTITDIVQKAMLEKLVIVPINPIYYKFLSYGGKQKVMSNPTADVISFSGGVGDLKYRDSFPNDLEYGDIGVFLRVL